MSAQKIDIHKPLINTRVGPIPVVLRIATTPTADHVAGGVPVGVTKIESYVLVSAMPTDLQERIRLAIDTMIAGR